MQLFAVVRMRRREAFYYCYLNVLRNSPLLVRFSPVLYGRIMTIVLRRELHEQAER